MSRTRLMIVRTLGCGTGTDRLVASQKGAVGHGRSASRRLNTRVDHGRSRGVSRKWEVFEIRDSAGESRLSPHEAAIAPNVKRVRDDPQRLTRR